VQSAPEESASSVAEEKVEVNYDDLPSL